MTLRTANHNARRALRKQVLRDAFDYDMRRVERLTASGRLDKRRDSGFVIRSRRRSKEARFMFATSSQDFLKPAFEGRRWMPIGDQNA